MILTFYGIALPTISRGGSVEQVRDTMRVLAA